VSGDRASEAEVIRLVRRMTTGAGGSGVRRGVGDDCAILETASGDTLLATTDLLVEDVHFRRRWAEPADLGWKAIAVNVSDIAAMGGVPRWALVGLACPEQTRAEEIEAFYEGALALARALDVAIVGGDTSSSPSGWMIDVTLLGEALEPPILRSTAHVGDVVAVTGTLGRSGAGLALLEGDGAPAGLAAGLLADLTAAHLRPRPRVVEARWLAATGAVTAMMDLSDGLATDLARLVEESAVGARVEVERVPIDTATRALADALGLPARAWATGAGEDYELLLTCAPASLTGLRAGLAEACGTPLTAIGEIIAGGGIRWLDARGDAVLVAAGFEHFAGRAGSESARGD
jgi:thiamine-monophosphate kinase